MTIRSHRSGFWFRLTPGRIRQPRNRWHPSATSLTTERVPVRLVGWLFHLCRGELNRTGQARHAVRLENRRSWQRSKPRLRMAAREPRRLFLPRRTGIHDGPVR